MSTLQMLQKLFTGGGPENNVSPDGRPLKGPVVSYLEQMGLSPPIDEQAEKHRALQRGLAEFAKSISSSNQDFLPALAGAIPQGASSYLDVKDDTDKKKRERNKELLANLIGMAKNDDTNDIRTQIADQRDATTNTRLDEIERHNLAGEGLGGEKLDLARLLGIIKASQGDEKLGLDGKKVDETGRHNLVTEGQGGEKIDETGRHNIVTEGQGQEKIGLDGQKVEETGRHNTVTEAQGDQKIKQGDERIKAATEKAALQSKALIARINAEAQRGKYTEAQIAQAKTNTKTKMLELKIKELGMSDTLRVTDPEAYEKARAEYTAYSNTIDKEFNTGASDATSSATPVPQPDAAAEAVQPQVSNTKETPAKPTSRAEFDALPPGSFFLNPSNGKLMRKKAASGGQ